MVRLSWEYGSDIMEQLARLHSCQDIYGVLPFFIHSIDETTISKTSLSGIILPTTPLLLRIDKLHLPRWLY